MERRSRHNKNKDDSAEVRDLLNHAKLSDSNSSSSDAASDDSYDDDDGQFVVGGQYTDFEKPEKKISAKPKKGKEQPVQKTTLFSILENQSKSSKTKAKAKTSNARKNDDLELDSILKDMEVEEDDPRKKKSKNKKGIQSKPQYPAFLTKKSEHKYIDIDDFDVSTPPPPEPEEVKVEPKNAEVITPLPVEEKPEAKKEEMPVPPQKKPIQEAPVERFTNFELEQVDLETAELTSEEISTYQNIDIPLPSDKSMDLFLFHVQEDNGHLYLFCKYKYQGNYSTICIFVGQCFYNLQFLPIEGEKEEMEQEIRAMCRKAKFHIKSAQYLPKRYCFERVDVPNFAEWYCVQVSPKGDLKQIKEVGQHYSAVFGLTSTLTERFNLEKNVFGPSWIRVTEIEKMNQYTTCPMFSIRDIDSITVLKESQIPRERVPSFNICTFALQTVLDNKNRVQIVMATMNVLYNWNIETYEPYQSKQTKNQIRQKTTTFICKNRAMSSSKNPGHVICEDERDLLIHFVEDLHKYDIDFLSSFGLNNVDIPLIYEKLVQHKVKNYHLLGRINRRLPSKTKCDVVLALSGRLPADIRVSCIEFLRSKVNDFSAIVKDQLQKERQSIENFDISQKLTKLDELKNLINFNVRDTIFVSTLLKKIEVLSLTMQISKLSACPWSRVLLGSSSHRCETLLLQNFYQDHYIFPEKPAYNGNENMKRESKYKGGMVLDPIRGFYDTCILVLDFNSLYPSIIREFNICFTTVDKTKPNAVKSKNSQIKGILPRIMAELLGARGEVKIERKKLQDRQNNLDVNSNEYKSINLDIGRLNIKEKALKLLANSIYGYLGFKGSRFLSTGLAALVTEQGRMILQDTVKTMQNMCGSESAVIYGDTDSVMVNSCVVDIGEANKKAIELSNAISKKYTHLKLGIDYIFLKMLLVQKKKYAALVYHENGSEIKRSGLDMVRRDWSTLTRNMSEFIIQQFMIDQQDKDTAINNILNELSAISAILRNGGKPINSESQESEDQPIHSSQYPEGIPIDDLLIYKALKKNIDQYSANKNNPPHVVVALRMKQHGIIVTQGTTIPYYICKSEARDIGSKAKSKEEVNNDYGLIDVEWYLNNQLLHPLWRLCQPFGQMQISELSNALGCQSSVPMDIPTDGIQSSSCYQIPRICELVFTCRGCESPIVMTTKYDECLICKKSGCGYHNNWKEVANQLTEYVQNFVINPKMSDKSLANPRIFGCDGYLCTYKTAQLPLSSTRPIHTNGYTSDDDHRNGDNKMCKGKITAIVSASDTFNTLRYFKELFAKPKKEVDVMPEFRQYMENIMQHFYEMHDFSRVNFKTLLNPE